MPFDLNYLIKLGAHRLPVVNVELFSSSEKGSQVYETFLSFQN
jgi:hypothetical protein